MQERHATEHRNLYKSYVRSITLLNVGQVGNEGGRRKPMATEMRMLHMMCEAIRSFVEWWGWRKILRVSVKQTTMGFIQ